MSKKNKTLNKGLDALLGQTNPNQRAVKEINLSTIKPGRFQPRTNFDNEKLEELTKSIKNQGVLSPILVRELGLNEYEVIAGERRLRATKMAGLETIPCLVDQKQDQDALVSALIENLQRSDLNIIEEAEGFRSLMLKFEFTQEKLSSQLGKSRSHIANVLRLLSLPNTVKRHISNGDLSFGHARVLVSLPEEKAKEVADRIIDEELSVRKVEKLVNQIKRTQAVSSNSKNYDTIDNSNNVNIDYLERELTVLLGLKVEFNHKNNNSGTMSIRYKTLDQIQPVIDKLKWKPK